MRNELSVALNKFYRFFFIEINLEKKAILFL